MKRTIITTFMAALVLTALGCGGGNSSAAEQAKEQPAAYRHISSEEAQALMEKEMGYIILDVRTPKEYAEGHIKDAVNVPNESISGTPPQELKDKSQLILVYCRSGARSKDAAQKLVHMGYTNIVDFGGIIDWHGDVVK